MLWRNETTITDDNHWCRRHRRISLFSHVARLDPGVGRLALNDALRLPQGLACFIAI